MPKTLIPWNLTQIFLACNLLWDVITRQVYLAFYSYYCTKKYQNLRESEIIILNKSHPRETNQVFNLKISWPILVAS